MLNSKFTGLLSSKYSDGGALDPIAVVTKKPVTSTPDDGSNFVDLPQVRQNPLLAPKPAPIISAPIAPAPIVSKPASISSTPAPVASKPIAPNDGSNFVGLPTVNKPAPAPIVAQPVKPIAQPVKPVASPVKPVASPVKPVQPPIDNFIGLPKVAPVKPPTVVTEPSTPIGGGMLGIEPIASKPSPYPVFSDKELAANPSNGLYVDDESRYATPQRVITPTQPVEPVAPDFGIGGMFGGGGGAIPNLNNPINFMPDFGLPPIGGGAGLGDIGNFQGGIGGVSGGFDVSAPAFEETGNYLNTNDNAMKAVFGEDYLQNGLYTGSLNIQEGQDPNALLNNVVNSDIYKQSFDAMMQQEGVTEDMANASLRTHFGLPSSIMEEGIYGGEQRWLFNNETGQYESDTNNLKDKPSALETAIPLIGGAIITAGFASALAPSIGAAFGAGSAASSGISGALVNGTVTALQGGDIGDIARTAVLSGVTGYVSGLGSELEGVQSQLDAAFQTGDMSNVYALTSEVDRLNGLIDIATNTDKALQFANLVDQGGDPFKSAISVFGQDIASYINVNDTINSGLTELFGGDVADVLMQDNAFTATLLDQAAGRNLGESLADRYGNQVADWLSDGTKNGKALGFAGIKTISEYGKTGDASGALFDGVREYFDKGGDGKAIEDWLKDLAPEIDLGSLFKLGEDSSLPDLSWIEDGLREAGRYVDDKALQPVKDFLVGMIPKGFELPDVGLPEDFIDLGAVKDAVKQGAKDIQDNILTPIEDNVLKPIEKAVKDNIPKIDLPKDFIDLPSVNIPKIPLPDFNLPSVNLPDISGSLPSVDLPSVGLGGLGGGAMPVARRRAQADNSALAKMNTGQQYTFEDLRTNPLLNNELFS